MPPKFPKLPKSFKNIDEFKSYCIDQTNAINYLKRISPSTEKFLLENIRNIKIQLDEMNKPLRLAQSDTIKLQQVQQLIKVQKAIIKLHNKKLSAQAERNFVEAGRFGTKLLAYNYLTGRSLPKKPEKAVEILENAVTKEHPKNDTPYSFLQMKKWLQIPFNYALQLFKLKNKTTNCAHGYSGRCLLCLDEKVLLAQCYIRGIGTPPQPNRGLFLLAETIAENSTNGIIYRSIMFRDGKAGIKSYSQALSILYELQKQQKSLEEEGKNPLGKNRVLYLLAIHYRDGLGVKKNPEMAEQLFAQADHQPDNMPPFCDDPNPGEEKTVTLDDQENYDDEEIDCGCSHRSEFKPAASEKFENKHDSDSDDDRVFTASTTKKLRHKKNDFSKQKLNTSAVKPKEASTASKNKSTPIFKSVLNSTQNALTTLVVKPVNYLIWKPVKFTALVVFAVGKTVWSALPNINKPESELSVDEVVARINHSKKQTMKNTGSHETKAQKSESKPKKTNENKENKENRPLVQKTKTIKRSGALVMEFPMKPASPLKVAAASPILAEASVLAAEPASAAAAAVIVAESAPAAAAVIVAEPAPAAAVLVAESAPAAEIVADAEIASLATNTTPKTDKSLQNKSPKSTAQTPGESKSTPEAKTASIDSYENFTELLTACYNLANLRADLITKESLLLVHKKGGKFLSNFSYKDPAFTTALDQLMTQRNYSETLSILIAIVALKFKTPADSFNNFISATSFGIFLNNYFNEKHPQFNPQYSIFTNFCIYYDVINTSLVASVPPRDAIAGARGGFFPPPVQQFGADAGAAIQPTIRQNPTP